MKFLCIYNTVSIEPMNALNYCSRKEGVQSNNRRSMMFKNLWVRAKLAKICKEFYKCIQIKIGVLKFRAIFKNFKVIISLNKYP